MPVSVFDLFKIGIGPSSSHTMGPMKAARRFALELDAARQLDRVANLTVTLFGSLGATGKGHCTDTAILLGLNGLEARTVDLDEAPKLIAQIRDSGRLRLLGRHEIPFVERDSLLFKGGERLPFHPNGMRLTALDAKGAEVRSGEFYSLGGGFIVSAAEATAPEGTGEEGVTVPYPFHNAKELVNLCNEHGLSVSSLVLANEKALRPEGEIFAELGEIWRVMKECVQRGIDGEGELPGGLRVKRRAPHLAKALTVRPTMNELDPLASLDWVDLYALAVGEENACGGRVVTAPTNGAAGVIPAVMHYCAYVLKQEDEEKLARFLLTAAAIGSLYKENASFSAADVGCQGEIGTACSMAAGALAEFLGGSPEQVENAAEIGMEHNLGLTCDPIGGLVQIPCIERNAMGAVKAINAARLSRRREGKQFVSLDKVIRTMKDTGRDMLAKYKETSEGGLAVNVPEC